MSEWMPIERWPECVDLEKPGIIFELQNAAGQSLFTSCVPRPSIPFDWSTPPVRYRAIIQTPPQRSTPVPAPKRN